ncbi:MAG: hypothetical protein WCC25_08625 [Candidatus Korobacteraceae bacterium]
MRKVDNTQRYTEQLKLVFAASLVAVLAAVLQPVSCSAQAPQAKPAEPKVLEEKLPFPPPIQWKVGDVEFSLIGIAWGPADSPEMITKGHQVETREKPEFFADRTFALALRLRARRPETQPEIVTVSDLARIKNVEGDREYPWALTPSGFVQQFPVGRPGIWDVHFQQGELAEYWDFFPASPDDKQFLFEVDQNGTPATIAFRIILSDNKLLVINDSPAKPAQFTREFSGTIAGDIKLKMQLTAHGSELSGTEQYTRIGKTLAVHGAVDSLGNFRLTEFYPENRPAGIFDGKFSPTYLEMTGYFAKPDGSKLQPFSLREISSIDSDYPAGAGGPAPCPTTETPPGWKTYVNEKYRFCFSYPPIYTPVDEPWGPKYSDTPEYADQLRKAAEEWRLSRLDDAQEAGDSVIIQIGTGPFDLQELIKCAPTGEEGPPRPSEILGRTFYYYGPGGGGVCYPDQFFYNLRGKTLTVSFTGPCVDDKTPSPQTKVIEQEMLASFRTF